MSPQICKKIVRNFRATNTYGNGRLDILDVGFLLKDLFGSSAQSFDLGFLDVLTLLELFNPLVDIVIGSTASFTCHYLY